MKIITGDRQTGKTTELLKELRKNPYAILVVASDVQALKLRQNHNDIKYRIFSIREFQHGWTEGKFTHNTTVCIDDLRDILQYLFQMKIDTLAISASEIIQL